MLTDPLTTRRSLILLAVLAGVVLFFGIGQFQVLQHHKKIVSESDRLLFQFTSVREFIAGALVEKRYSDLAAAAGELETLGVRVTDVLKNPVIPDSYKATLMRQVDIPGAILLAKQIAGVAEPLKIQQLHEHIRKLGDQILLFDRMVSSHIKKKVIGYQSLVIGILVIVLVAVANFLFFHYRDVMRPLICFRRKVSVGAAEWTDTDLQAGSGDWISEFCRRVLGLIKRHDESREELLRLKVLVQECPISLVLLSANGRIVEASRSAVKIFSPENDDIAGHSLAALVPEKYRQRVADLIAAKHEPAGSSVVLRKGQGVPLALTFFPVTAGKDSLLGVTVVSQGASPVAANEMIRMNRLGLVGQMASGVCHEVNDAANCIINRGQLCIDEVADAHDSVGLRAMIKCLLDDGERVAALVGQFLKISHDPDVAGPTREPERLLTAISSLVTSQFRQDGIGLKVRHTPPLAAVACPPSVFRLVTLNLLQAGRRWVKQHAVGRDPDAREVSLWCREETQAGGEICLLLVVQWYVGQTGGDGSTTNDTREHDGCQLEDELSLCRAIVESEQGLLRIDRSRVGECVVECRLPVAL